MDCPEEDVAVSLECSNDLDCSVCINIGVNLQPLKLVWCGFTQLARIAATSRGFWQKLMICGSCPDSNHIFGMFNFVG